MNFFVFKPGESPHVIEIIAAFRTYRDALDYVTARSHLGLMVCHTRLAVAWEQLPAESEKS